MNNLLVVWIFKLTFFVIILSMTTVVLSQTQVLKGNVIDIKAAYPLPGVTIVIQNTNPVIGTITDTEGNYRLENVPYGRHTVVFSFIGYKSVVIPNVLVNSGKQTVLNISMEESVESLKEVVITDTRSGDVAQNEMAKVSARTFSTEQVNRFSGGRNDIARMVTSFAGVSAPNDQRNDIVVRGNAPTGLLWRIEGVPIATTNHFATLGTTGGPVSALNTNLIKTSDFLTSAFPAEYGNANAAVFDVKYRNGNKDKHEFTGQIAAFSGLEIMLEGPLSKRRGASYLISGRYGIAAVGAPGTKAKPYYSDLAFNFNFGKTKIGTFKLFGFGGQSHIDFKADETDEVDLYANPNEDAFPRNKIALFGLSNTLRLSKNSFLLTTVGGSINHAGYEQFNYERTQVPNIRYKSIALENNDNRLSVSSILNSKISKRVSIRTGFVQEFYLLNFDVQSRDDLPQIPDLNSDGIPDFFLQVRDINETVGLTQVYTQTEFKFTDELSLNTGLHSQYLGFSKKFALEPRLGLAYNFRPNQKISLAYGNHSQMVPMPILFKQEQDPFTKEITRTNDNLDFMKSRHYVLGYERSFGLDWQLKIEGYHQQLYNVPVESTPSSYSVINDGADFTFQDKYNLTNAGTGSNTGVELTLEKAFSEGYYILVTTSIYDSKYKGSDDIERQTAFNNQYVFNVLGGKEWEIWNGNGAITFDTKFTRAGGKPYTPIDIQASIANGNTEVRIEDQAFTKRIDPYMRWDTKIGFRWNDSERKMAHHWFLDFQNVLNRKNQFLNRYNEVTQKINTVTQSGLFIDVLYRIQF